MVGHKSCTTTHCRGNVDSTLFDSCAITLLLNRKHVIENFLLEKGTRLKILPGSLACDKSAQLKDQPSGDAVHTHTQWHIHETIGSVNTNLLRSSLYLIVYGVDYLHSVILYNRMVTSSD